MKLSDWAKIQGIKYETAWRHYKKGLIKGAYQLPTGTIVVPNESSSKPMKVAVYARASSSVQKQDLERQSQRLIDFCNARGWQVNVVTKEVASGLNDKKKKLQKLLVDNTITHIVVEHKDRLTRFGAAYIETLLEIENRQLVIVNNVDGDKEDLMEDFISIITSFTARIYGQRRSKRKTEKIIEQLKSEN